MIIHPIVPLIMPPTEAPVWSGSLPWETGAGGGVWTPEALGSKLKLWMDGTTGVVTSSGKVTSWTSRVGGHAFTQGTDAQRPLTRLVNGRTAIDFDGSNDNVIGPDKQTIGIALATPQEVVAVYLADALAAFSDVDAPGIVGDSSAIWGLTVGSAAQYYCDYNAAVTLKFATSATAPLVDTVYRARGTYDAVNTMTAQNGSGAVGTTGSTGAPYNPSAGQFVRLGISPSLARSFNGCICEVFAFDATLSTAESAQLDAYLAAKWGAQT